MGDSKRIPRWLLRHMTQPRGVWLPHRERLVKEYISALVQSPIRVNSLDERIMEAMPQRKLPKDFENWEYRFWLPESEDAATMPVTECRACGQLFFITKARREHLSAMGCAKRLIDAFGLLLKDKLCVVCDTKTERRIWGVPMCGAVCQTIWVTELSQPQALKMALDLVP